MLGRLDKSSELTWQPVPGGWEGAAARACRRSELLAWPALTELFPWQLSGVQLKRTWPIGSTPEVLRERWRRLLALPDGERRAAFGPRAIATSIPHRPTPGWRDASSAVGRLTPDAQRAPSPCATPTALSTATGCLPDARLGDFHAADACGVWRARDRCF